MKEYELNSLNESDCIKLNYTSAKEFRGRFNTWDTYKVTMTRVGRMIKDDSGQARSLHNIYKHFHRADKWN